MRSRRLLRFDLWYQPRRRDPSARLPQCFSGGFPLHYAVSSRPFCRAPAMPPIYNQGAPAISAVQRCHQPRIFGPACLDAETEFSPRRSNGDLPVFRCPVKCLTVGVDSELAIVEPAFGAQPIGMAHFVAETVNEALLLGLKFRLS